MNCDSEAYDGCLLAVAFLAREGRATEKLITSFEDRFGVDLAKPGTSGDRVRLELACVKIVNARPRPPAEPAKAANPTDELLAKFYARLNAYLLSKRRFCSSVPRNSELDQICLEFMQDIRRLDSQGFRTDCDVGGQDGKRKRTNEDYGAGSRTDSDVGGVDKMEDED